MKIKFERCDSKDLEIIDRLYTQMSIDEGKLQFKKISKNEMLRDLKKHKKERREGFLKELKDNRRNFWYFVKFKNKNIGFIHAQIDKKDKTTANLEKVYVLKEFRGKGIAKKLCSFVLRLLKLNKVESVESNIFSLNSPSIRLHKSLGFKHYSMTLRKKL